MEGFNSTCLFTVVKRYSNINPHFICIARRTVKNLAWKRDIYSLYQLSWPNTPQYQDVLLTFCAYWYEQNMSQNFYFITSTVPFFPLIFFASSALLKIANIYEHCENCLLECPFMELKASLFQRRLYRYWTALCFSCNISTQSALSLCLKQSCKVWVSFCT